MGKSSGVFDASADVRAGISYPDVDHLIVSALPTGVVVQVEDGRIIRCNAAAERVLGLSEAQMLGVTSMDPLWRAVHEDGTDFPGDTHPAMVALRTGDPVVDVVMGVHKPDGTLTWIKINSTPVAAEVIGPNSAVITTFSDITGQVATQHEAESLSQFIFENASDVIVKIGEGEVIEWISPSVTALLGWTPEELVGTRSAAIVTPEGDGQSVEVPHALRDGEEALSLVQVRHKNGRQVLVECRSRMVDSDSAGRQVRIDSWRDITAATRLRERADESEGRFRLLAENATDVVYENDRAGVIKWISLGVRATLGWEPEDLVDTPSLDLIHPDDAKAVLALRGSILAGGTLGVTLARFKTKSGTYRWMSARAQLVHDDDGNGIGLVLGLRDVQEERAAHERLAFLAFHDTLTGLRNRQWILDTLESDLAVARGDRSRVAVLFFDLDNFKVINDSLGHATGDGVLVAAAHHLSQALLRGERVGRFGGDEFIVIASSINDSRDVDVIAARLLAAVTREVMVDGQPLTLSASIGIAVSDSEATAISLLRDADSAMFRAKAAGRSRWEHADPDMHAQAMARLSTEAELRKAVTERQFVVHFQPIVALNDARIVGYEALVRWNHPHRGLIPPAEFLPVAEASSLIVEIGDQVFNQVCALLASRPDLTVPISVNKSSVQVARPGWRDQFLAQLDAHGIDPRRIIVELTETAILAVLDRTKSDLTSLRREGVGIHVDDFGTGYSTIALLRDLPVTGLKLDLSFTRDLATSETARALAAGLAGLVKGLGIDGIAEGIETTEQAGILREQGWNQGQGYLYGSPGPLPPA